MSYRMVETQLVIVLAVLTLFGSSDGGGSLATVAETVNSANFLPNDVQVSAFLRQGQPKTLYYWSSMAGGSLSVTVSACTATIRWSLRFQEKNETVPASQITTLHNSTTTRSLQTQHILARRGLFSLVLEALDHDGGVSVYMSTEPGGPQPLQQKHPPLRLQHRQRRTQLSVKWNQSLVDPHMTSYCLVVNQKRNYSTLCEALEERYGPGFSVVNIPDLSKPKSRAMKRFDFWDKSRESPEEPKVICVGSQTQYTLSNLEHGKMYYFNLFAISGQTNFTYPVATQVMRFYNHVKPTTLKDGKSTFVNLKKLDGKVVFRYKASRYSSSPLHFYIMPCGGAVDVEVTLRGTDETGSKKTVPVEPRQRIDGYGRITVQDPVKRMRYYVRVVASNREELKRTTGVEVLATKYPSSSPLPLLPTPPILHEYTSMRQCDSVTVGWLVAADRGQQRYCLVVREGRLHENGPANHCRVEQRMRREDYSMRRCWDVARGDRDSKVVTQTISQLKSGRSYVIQVTVEKPKGKTLSYNLLQVHTRKKCESYNSN